MDFYYVEVVGEHSSSGEGMLSGVLERLEKQM